MKIKGQVVQRHMLPFLQNTSLDRQQIRTYSKGPGKGPRIVERKIRIYDPRKECTKQEPEG